MGTLSSSNRPQRRRRRTHVKLAIVAVAGIMGVGGAVTAANAVASDASTARSAHAVPTISPSVDIDALWTELGQLSLADRANTFAALRPDVRARIHAAADELAAAAAH